MNPSVSRAHLAGLHEQTYRWALFCCGFDPDYASEVVQTVYVEILSGRAQFHGHSTLKTWIFAVVKHTARRLHARLESGERLKRRLAAAVEPDAAELIDDVIQRDADQAETKRLVQQALERLPARQRAVIELIYYHDTTMVEAADILGISAGSAAQHLHRGKRTLARALQPVKGACQGASQGAPHRV
jgi:RNA polymerase sigma factor (sigma-70 family)